MSSIDHTQLCHLDRSNRQSHRLLRSGETPAFRFCRCLFLTAYPPKSVILTLSVVERSSRTCELRSRRTCGCSWCCRCSCLCRSSFRLTKNQRHLDRSNRQSHRLLRSGETPAFCLCLCCCCCNCFSCLSSPKGICCCRCYCFSSSSVSEGKDPCISLFALRFSVHRNVGAPERGHDPWILQRSGSRLLATVESPLKVSYWFCLVPLCDALASIIVRTRSQQNLETCLGYSHLRIAVWRRGYILAAGPVPALRQTVVHVLANCTADALRGKRRVPCPGWDS